MSNQILLPIQNTYVSSDKPDINHPCPVMLQVGMDLRGVLYRSLIFFDLEVLPSDIDVDSAVLRMYAGYVTDYDVEGYLAPYTVASRWDTKEVTWNNQPQYDMSVKENAVAVTTTGWYSWDITSLAKMWADNSSCNYGMLIKSTEDKRRDSKRFHAVKSYFYKHYKPYLELKYHFRNTFCLGARNTVNIYERYKSYDIICSTAWQNTSIYSMYTFFVKNSGQHPVSLHVEVSPDKYAVYHEAAVYNLAPGDTEAIVPQRYGFYSRLSFKSFLMGRHSILQVWFQAQV